MMKILLITVALLVMASTGSDLPYEWAGIFSTPDSTYTWIAQKVGGSYADASMKIVALPVSDASDAILNTVDSKGRTSLGLTCEDVPDQGVIMPQEYKCYKLIFSSEVSQSSFTVDASAMPAIAFFTEHVPTEFENTDHYFKNSSGTDIEPVAELPDNDGDHEDHAHHHGHGHSNLAYEWAGIFSVPENFYMWTAQKVDGDYADATMKIAAIPVSSASHGALDSVERDGNEALGLQCDDLLTGGVITPNRTKCYKMIFDQHMWQSLYSIDASTTPAIAFFCQHYPTEFEATAHYLKDKMGDDVEPVAELPEQPEEPPKEAVNLPGTNAPWAEGIVASVIVNLITLVGVLLAIPALARVLKNNHDQAQAILSGFAAGAILACAFFLLLFEATHLVATGWTEEVDVLWRWGTAILAGMMLPGMVDLLGSLVTATPAETDGATDVESPGTKDSTSWSIKLRIFLGVNIGDFFHNLCDGLFMGAAFKGCGNSFGWGVTLATALHEFPQELADYVLLTGPPLSLSPVKALASNFVAGLGVVLGTIIIFATEVDDAATGVLLAFGGGVYLHIGAVECLPKVYAHGLPSHAKAQSILAFIFGAVLIGLILLDHEHCVPPPPPGQEATAAQSGGHAHGH